MFDMTSTFFQVEYGVSAKDSYNTFCRFVERMTDKGSVPWFNSEAKDTDKDFQSRVLRKIKLVVIDARSTHILCLL